MSYAKFWEPLDIDCPNEDCAAPQGISCRDRGAQIKSSNHLARFKVPVLYVCDVCKKLCSVGLLSKELLHIGKVDTTHSARSSQRRRPAHELQR